jgi:hypothetical protein
MIGMKRQQGQDKKERTAKKGLLEQGRQNSTDNRGQAELDRQT